MHSRRGRPTRKGEDIINVDLREKKFRGSGLHSSGPGNDN